MPEDEKNKPGFFSRMAKTYGDAAKTIQGGQLGAINQLLGKSEPPQIKPMDMNTSKSPYEVPTNLKVKKFED
jgi:hypothetical protein